METLTMNYAAINDHGKDNVTFQCTRSPPLSSNQLTCEVKVKHTEKFVLFYLTEMDNRESLKKDTPVGRVNQFPYLTEICNALDQNNNWKLLASKFQLQDLNITSAQDISPTRLLLDTWIAKQSISLEGKRILIDVLKKIKEEVLASKMQDYVRKDCLESRESKFNEMLCRISEQIKEDELTRLKNRCWNIPDSELEKMKAYNIFKYMLEKQIITFDNTVELEGRLKSIGRNRLVEIVKDYHKGGS
ncbi:uncharacterized protein LOC144357083 [Saccoglossus kowalevskii]